MAEAKAIEFIPCDEGLTVAVTKTDDEIVTHHMTWEQFEVLRSALEKSDG